MTIHRIAVKAAFFINGFVYANWVSRLPRIQDIYHADNGAIGLVLLASSIGAIGAMPFTGWIIIKHGSRRVTLFSAILFCLLIPLIPHLVHIALLGLLLFAIGIIMGMLDVSMNAQAVLVEEKYNRPIMTSFHAFFSIGMMLGAWTGTLFVDMGIDLSLHLILVVAASVLVAIWMGFNLVHDRPDPALRHEGPLFQLPNASLINIGIIAFCCMLGEGAMADWSVNYMQNIQHAPVAIAPIALSAFATSMTLGRLVGDRLRFSLGDKTLMIGSGITATIGLGISLFIPDPYIAIAGFFLVGLGLSTIVPIAYSIAGKTKDLPPGVGLAMVTTVGYGGFLIGPPLIGFIADWKDLRLGLMTVGVLFLTMTVLGFLYPKPIKD